MRRGRLAATRHRLGLGLALALLIIGLDRLTKWWALAHLADPPGLIEILPFLDVVLVWNRGVSFGLFNADGSDLTWVFVGVAVGVSIGLIVWLRRISRLWVGLAVGLILGGALGNVIDRLIYGAVVDFVDLHAGSYHWPAFNLADAGITVGVVFLAIDALLKPWKRHR